MAKRMRITLPIGLPAQRKMLGEFIRENRVKLDEIIARLEPGAAQTDDVRESWILREVSLYCWAKREGCSI